MIFGYPVSAAFYTAASDEVRQQGESMLSDRTALLVEVSVETSLLESDDVVSALVEENADQDLTILGATREGVIQKLVSGTIPETVAERVPTTVIMTRRALGVRTRLQESLDKRRERVSGAPNAIEQDGTGSETRD
jgi:nucleotide-binding universal stress UspA family protein